MAAWNVLLCIAPAALDVRAGRLESAPNDALGAHRLRAACSDDCRFARDGECDDGGSGADYRLCPCGADCSDCGKREYRDCPAGGAVLPFSHDWWRLDSVEAVVVQTFFAILFCLWNSVIFGVLLPRSEMSERVGCCGACLCTAFLAPFVRAKPAAPARQPRHPGAAHCRHLSLTPLGFRPPPPNLSFPPSLSLRPPPTRS